MAASSVSPMRAMARPKPKKTPAKPLAEDDATAQTSCALYFCGPPQRPPDDDDATTTTPRAQAELAQVKSVVVSSADPPGRPEGRRPLRRRAARGLRHRRDDAAEPRPRRVRTSADFAALGRALNVENPGCVVPPVTAALRGGSVRAATLFFERLLSHGAQDESALRAVLADEAAARATPRARSGPRGASARARVAAEKALDEAATLNARLDLSPGQEAPEVTSALMEGYDRHIDSVDDLLGVLESVRAAADVVRDIDRRLGAARAAYDRATASYGRSIEKRRAKSAFDGAWDAVADALAATEEDAADAAGALGAVERCAREAHGRFAGEFDDLRMNLPSWLAEGRDRLIKSQLDGGRGAAAKLSAKLRPKPGASGTEDGRGPAAGAAPLLLRRRQGRDRRRLLRAARRGLHDSDSA
ncbi:hypothetical protein JL722_2231 [Aureococcus anophagefferens]|nr:hypothetical protein JL722_2231 [Aureococcus anophagefferens]